MRCRQPGGREGGRAPLQSSDHGADRHQINWDRRIVNQAERARESLTPITKEDYKVRLDFESLLAPDALQAKTDNPDETVYWKGVEHTLKNLGVWLRFAPKSSVTPKATSSLICGLSTSGYL